MFICPYCDQGLLELVEADPPYTEEHLGCPICDSTFNFEIIEAGEV